VSINLYMFHGGTNFGFTSGANYTRRIPIEPSMTSYDYDAPLSEAGWPTPKYYALRDVIRRHVSYPIPDVPDSLPVIALPAVTVTANASLFDLVANIKPVRAEQPLSFADIDQSDGFVLYRHRFARATNGLLEVPGLRDYGEVFVNGARVATLERSKNSFAVRVQVPAGGRLDILVENLGRINYGADLVIDRKGIIEPVVLDGTRLTGWEMYRLPFSAAPAATAARARNAATAAIAGVPAVYRGTFTLARTGDTFLDMRTWNKGIVFVNGINLGRYWNVGPQQTLYLPGAWLHRGQNEIVIIDLDGRGAAASVAGLRTPILDQLNVESVGRP
ncbi:MAG: beta-galactosidase, partial [Gemmatimonadaceae bacterium]